MTASSNNTNNAANNGIAGMIIAMSTAGGISKAINAQANSVVADCELIDGVEIPEEDLKEVRKMRAVINGLPTNFSGTIFGSAF